MINKEVVISTVKDFHFLLFLSLFSSTDRTFH